MKLNKLILPLAVALVALLATTGCKHGTTKTTLIPGRPNAVGDQGLGSTIPFDPSAGGAGSTGGTGGTGGGTGGTGTPLPPWNPGDYTPDRPALAAYTVHFQYDSAVVQDKEQVKLVSVAQALSSSAADKLQIEGHCDERGTEEYNRALGDRRAGALREALIHNGADSQRITTISYGKDRPVDKGPSDASHAKNRRGEFILLHPK
jgi:peptidoglycan-associated lipoprotein